jgi:hypothetical protein
MGALCLRRELQLDMSEQKYTDSNMTLRISLCKQTSDLFRWQYLISKCAVHTYNPCDQITK